MLDAIDAVNWAAVAGPPDWYEPDRVAPGLRALTGATNVIQAAKGGSLLGCGGIVHDHSGSVFPAAAVAAPFLLDIAQRGHPAARDTALGLLDEALSFVPHAGYTRVATPGGEAVRICCALAHEVRSRAGFLSGQAQEGRFLLEAAAGHWRFEIRECVADGDGAAAFGMLSGRLPGGAAHAAELHVGGSRTAVDEVVLECQSADGGSEGCLRVSGRRPHELPPGATLFPAACGAGGH